MYWGGGGDPLRGGGGPPTGLYRVEGRRREKESPQNRGAVLTFKESERKRLRLYAQWLYLACIRG